MTFYICFWIIALPISLSIIYLSLEKIAAEIRRATDIEINEIYKRECKQNEK